MIAAGSVQSIVVMRFEASSVLLLLSSLEEVLVTLEALLRFKGSPMGRPVLPCRDMTKKRSTTAIELKTKTNEDILVIGFLK